MGKATASDEIFFVESGRLEVVKKGVHRIPVRLAKVVAGSMIGEMALYSGRPRSASVIAVEEAVLRVLSRDNWQRMKQATRAGVAPGPPRDPQPGRHRGTHERDVEPAGRLTHKALQRLTNRNTGPG